MWLSYASPAALSSMAAAGNSPHQAGKKKAAPGFPPAPPVFSSVEVPAITAAG